MSIYLCDAYVLCTRFLHPASQTLRHAAINWHPKWADLFYNTLTNLLPPSPWLESYVAHIEEKMCDLNTNRSNNNNNKKNPPHYHRSLFRVFAQQSLAVISHSGIYVSSKRDILIQQTSWITFFLYSWRSFLGLARTATAISCTQTAGKFIQGKMWWFLFFVVGE